MTETSNEQNSNKLLNKSGSFYAASLSPGIHYTDI